MTSTKFAQNNTPHPTPPVCRRPLPTPSGIFIPPAFCLSWSFAIVNQFCTLSLSGQTRLVQDMPGTWLYTSVIPRGPGNPYAHLNLEYTPTAAYLYVQHEECYLGMTFTFTTQYFTKKSWPYTPKTPITNGHIESGKVTYFPFALTG